MNSTFKTITISGQSNLVAEGLDTLEIVAGNNISLTTNALSDPQQLTITGTYDDANVTSVLSGNVTIGNLSVTGAVLGYATTDYVDSELANLVNSAPAALDTLNELAAALGNDANFSSTVTSSIGNVAANVTILQGNVTNLNSYDDANVAAYLPTYSGNITAGNILTDNYRYANGDPFVSGGGATVTVGNVAPSSPSSGDFWINTDVMKQLVYVDDGDTSQWVDIMAATSLEINAYDDANVAAYLPTHTGNITAGNISASYFIGNGSQLTGLPAGYTDSDVDTVLAGNITVGNVSVNGTIDGHFIPTANGTYDLGSPTNRWNTLYLTGNTIDLGGATIRSDATEGTIALIPQVRPGLTATKAIVFGQRGIATVDTDQFGEVSAEAISAAANTAIITTSEVKADSYFFGNGDPMLSSAALRVGRRSGVPVPVRMSSGATIAIIGRNSTTLVSISV